MPNVVGYRGPLDARVVIVGEAPGEAEDTSGLPFVGSSGRELQTMLRIAGFDPGSLETYRENMASKVRQATQGEVLFLNVFNERPPKNQIAEFCDTKRRVEKDYVEQGWPGWLRENYPDLSWPDKYTWGPITSGKYIRPEYLWNLSRLKQEIEWAPRNLVIPVGNTPLWALTGRTKISSNRGVITESTLVPGQKVLPTFHPASIMRQWGNRPYMIADLKKAIEEATYPEIIFPHRMIHYNPQSPEVVREFLQLCEQVETPVAVDIETEPWQGQITCIGFAPGPDLAMSVPVVDKSQPGFNYWQDAKDEAAVLAAIRDFLAGPARKVMQNGVYDMLWLWRFWGMPTFNVEDSMICHHALQPEMEKKLEFLGSIYCNVPAWKDMVKHSHKEND